MPAKCPNCQNPPKIPHNPFCSERCATLDLGKWLTGKYTIPTNEPIETNAENVMPFPKKDS